MNEKIKAKLKKNPIVRFFLYPYIKLRRKKAQTFLIKLSENYDSFLDTVEAGSLIVRFDDFMGSFELGIHSSLLKRVFIFKEYERKLAQLALNHINPRKDVIDVGANIGLFTVLFSNKIHDKRRVLAIEPTPSSLKYLNSNIKRNNCIDNVIVYDGIATDQNGIYSLNVVDGREEYSSLGKLVHPDIKSNDSLNIEVKGDKIDNLVKKLGLEPGFIKIDVEGAEFLVLQGAWKTIIKNRPVILSELSENMLSYQGSSCEDVFNWFRKLNYNIYDAIKLTPVKQSMEGNILAIPDEAAKMYITKI